MERAGRVEERFDNGKGFDSNASRRWREFEGKARYVSSKHLQDLERMSDRKWRRGTENDMVNICARLRISSTCHIY